jgi:hypothetical protein
MESGSTVNAETDGERVDIICYGAIVDYGGEINADRITPFGGHYPMSE